MGRVFSQLGVPNRLEIASSVNDSFACTTEYLFLIARVAITIVFFTSNRIVRIWLAVSFARHDESRQTGNAVARLVRPKKLSNESRFVFAAVDDRFL